MEFSTVLNRRNSNPRIKQKIMPAHQIFHNRFVACAFAIFIGVSASSAFGQGTTSATTGIVGYNTTDCLGGSDTLISVPFHRTPEYSGSVAESGGVEFTGENDQIVVSGAPGWANGVFTDSHYVKVVTGAAAGLELPIVGNAGDSLTMNSAGFKGSKINPGDRFLVIPFWTLGELLPAATQTTVHASTGHLLSGRGSEVHFFEPSATGINLSPEKIYYATSAGWFQSLKGSPAADDVILPPHTAIVIRHQTGAADTQFRSAAHVDEDASAILLSARQGAAQDNVVAMMRPIPLTLGELDIPGSVFVSSKGTSVEKRRDELLVFDNSVVGYNKSEQARYFFDKSAGQWRIDDGAAFDVATDAEIPAGAVLVIRKSPASKDADLVWTNQATY